VQASAMSTLNIDDLIRKLLSVEQRLTTNVSERELQQLCSMI